MIRRKLLIATAIIASVVITACSDMTAPKNDPGVLPAAAILVPAFSGQASRPCPAPGTGLPGALNMLHDATMGTIPMARDAAQGNAGMARSVDVSGC